MADNNMQIVPATPQAVAGRYNQEEVAQEMSILRAAFPNLNADDQALRALVIASRWSGLSPFRGEIYYIPKIGIQVATKIKAADAVTHAARSGNTLDIKFERVTPAIIAAGGTYAPFSGAVKDGDVCFACRIISSKQRRNYYSLRVQLADEGRAYGYRGRELESWVDEKAGAPPEVIALGVVRKEENFGGDGKYSREDRAMKRALTRALALGGFSAPDTRQYGGVQIESERAENDHGAFVDSDAREVPVHIPQTPKVTMPDDWQDDPELPSNPPPLEKPINWRERLNAAGIEAKTLHTVILERGDNAVLASRMDTALQDARGVMQKNGSAKIEDIKRAAENLAALIVEAKNALQSATA